MDTDEGLTRLLPRWTEESSEIEIKKRNILNVLVNANNDLMIADDLGKVEDLCDKAKNFIKAEGEYAGDRGPEYIQANADKYPELVSYFGADVKTPKNHVISLQSDYGTSYEMYIKVQNELVAAYNQLRNELAQEKFGKPYDEEELSKEERVLYKKIAKKANTSQALTPSEETLYNKVNDEVLKRMGFFPGPRLTKEEILKLKDILS